MRRAAFVVTVVSALLLAFAAPVSADTSPGGPFRESGTSKYLNAFSSECVPQGGRTTCVETSLDAFSIGPSELVVCVYTYSYAYNERTGRGRFIGSEEGCSDVLDSTVLNITVSRDQIAASLRQTTIALSECNRRTCTATRTMTASASASGGPVGTFSNKGSFRDGTCTFRYSESGVSASVDGTLTIDGSSVAAYGYVQQSDFKVQESCR